MNTIWKFQFDIKPHQQIKMPRGAKHLHVGLDPRGRPSLWCQVEDDGPAPRDFDLFVIGTGHKIPIEADEYIGSFVWAHNSTVWHCYTGSNYDACTT